MNLIKAYFENKIKGYKEQDRIAQRRTNKDNSVNEEWLLNCVNKKCIHGGNHLYIEFKQGNVSSNITADRINNTDDHNINHICHSCVCCNCCKSN